MDRPLSSGAPLPGGVLWELETDDAVAMATARPNPRVDRTLVLLPPFGEGWSTWLRLWPAIAELGTCVALVAPAPRGAPSPGLFQTWSSVVRRVVDQAKGQTVFLIGASMGGLCALRAARQMPAEVQGVVCLGLRSDVRRLSYLESLFDVRTTQDMARLLKAMWVDPPALGEASLARLMEPLRSPALKAQLEAVARLDIGDETLQAVRAGVPVTFIYGADDGVLAAGMPDGSAAIPGVRHHTLASCGHYPHQQQWQACAGLIAHAVAGGTPPPVDA